MCTVGVPITFSACLACHECVWHVQQCRQSAALDDMMLGSSGDEDSLHLQRASATYNNKVSNR